MENAPTSPFSKAEDDKPRPVGMLPLIAGGLTLSIIVWFYGFVPRYDSDESLSLFGWLMSAWNDETGLEHGLCMPVVILGLIGYRFRDLRNAAASGRVSYTGLIAVFFGALLFFAAHRIPQPRFAAVGLPILLWGACHFLWGWRVAKIVIFPLVFFWLVIPWPPFYRAQTPLLLWVASLTHHACFLFGVETKLQGLALIPMNADLQPIYFGWGCSNDVLGLLTLFMISAAWAYVAKIRIWQKVLLFLSALPIAMLVNALRMVSILVIAENGDPRWATTTWHDWSGLLLVYPLSLLLLFALHSIFLGGLPWKKKAGSEVA